MLNKGIYPALFVEEVELCVKLEYQLRRALSTNRESPQGEVAYVLLLFYIEHIHIIDANFDMPNGFRVTKDSLLTCVLQQRSKLVGFLSFESMCDRLGRWGGLCISDA